MLCRAPTGCGFVLELAVFRTVVLERLRLPLQITDSHCECGGCLYQLGRNRGVCPKSGRLRSRAVAPERTLARICREAGAIVRTNVMLRDTNITVSALDERKVEVWASGLPLSHGAQLAIDITLRSALTTHGTASRSAARVDGAGFPQARRDKKAKYQSLWRAHDASWLSLQSRRGGRWRKEAVDFVESSASARSRDSLLVMQRSSFLSWRRRGPARWLSRVAGASQLL